MVFDFEHRGLVQLGTVKTGNDQKLLDSAIQAGSGVHKFPRDSSYSLFERDGADFSLSSMLSQTCSTGNRDGFDEATSSGTVLKKKKQRKRPCKSIRALRRKEQDVVDADVIV
ncbi:unnamed protein product [Arabis nemorensis]|uniref:Uncharacterized protein n=1 Tax=Arabis nemorensis TaxID=586526 RepID=A0A565C3R8_9BRAS|nr:unnamed protein product [Arabis nemorensis]